MQLTSAPVLTVERCMLSMATSDSTTHCIYRIVCVANGKVYIGQSINARERRMHHFSKLRTNQHYNFHLQKSFNKYGEGMFYFETLEKNIPHSKIDEREIFWIAHFNSHLNGFNATAGGHNHPNGIVKCEWNGVEYASRAECEKATGIPVSALRYRMSQGYSSDKDMDNRGKKFTWNGRNYKSLEEGAKELGISLSAMHDRLRKGYRNDSDMQNSSYRKEKGCEWNGVFYDSISHMAKALALDYSCAFYRVHEGMKKDSDIRKAVHPSKKCEWNGKTYLSIAAAASELGISHATMRYRLKSGYKSDSDMNIKSNTRRRTEYGRQTSPNTSG